MDEEWLAQIEARLKAATPGPWRWRGNGDDVYLQSQVSMSAERPFRETVLSASAEACGEGRDYVSVDADIRFNVDGCMVDAARLAVRPQSHNPWFIDGVNHPDAQFIAAAPTDIADLLAEVRSLRSALDGLVDGDPCQYDHHGYCQTHGIAKPCEMAVARAALGLVSLA